MSRPPRTEVSHAVPGRMRLRVTGLNDADRDEILDALIGLRETASVEVRTDRRTGSALLMYDPEELDPQSVLELVRKTHEALLEVAPPGIAAVLDRSLSTVAGTVHGSMSTANRTVLGATRGVVDLRVLTPITLAAMSLRQLLRFGPGIAKIPWYVLAYYSFDTFVKLHADRIGGPPEVVVEGREQS